VAAGLLAALLLAGCESVTSGTAVTSPTPRAAPSLPSLLEAPSPPATPAPPTGPAATAIADAARKTAESGSLRLRLSGQVTSATESGGNVLGTGESESPTRFHLLLTFLAGTQEVSTEIITIDGTSWGRQEGQAWKLISTKAAAGSDPRAYLNYASRVSDARDAGAEDRNGAPAHRYEATIGLGRTGATPSPGASPPAASAGRLVAWVDAAGRLVSQEISASTSQGTVNFRMDFLDLGAPVKVSPPDVAAASPTP
jgi:hypothetical protein